MCDAIQRKTILTRAADYRYDHARAWFHNDIVAYIVLASKWRAENSRSNTLQTNYSLCYATILLCNNPAT